jgi:hypothetical protein
MLSNDVVVLVIGSAQSKNDHLKVEVDVYAELVERFTSWLVNCVAEDYGYRQGMYIRSGAPEHHRILPVI